MSSVCSLFAVLMAGFSACQGFCAEIVCCRWEIKEDIRQVRLLSIMRCVGMRQELGSLPEDLLGIWGRGMGSI